MESDTPNVPVVAPRFRRDAIRIAKFGDQETIGKLEVSGFNTADSLAERRAFWRRVLLGPASGPMSRVWVAVEEREMVGVAYCDVIDDRPQRFAQLREFRVALYEQDRGIQTLLLQKGIKFAEQTGCSTLSVILPSLWESYEGDTQHAVARLGFVAVYEGPVCRTGSVVDGQVLVKPLRQREHNAPAAKQRRDPVDHAGNSRLGQRSRMSREAVTLVARSNTMFPCPNRMAPRTSSEPLVILRSAFSACSAVS